MKSKTGSAKKVKNAASDKNAMDLANAVNDMIANEYPGMRKEDAMRLAVLLTKVEIKGDL